MELATRHEFDLTLSSQVTGRGVWVNANAPELLWGLPGGTPGISSSGWVASPSPSQADETGDPTRESPLAVAKRRITPTVVRVESSLYNLREPGTTEESQRLNDKVNNNLLIRLIVPGHALQESESFHR